MKLHVYQDYNEPSPGAAGLILARLRHKPHAVVCASGGDMPRHAYSFPAKSGMNKGVTFDRCTFFGLISPENAEVAITSHYRAHHERYVA